MKISSPVFGNNQTIPPKYTCDSENISPLLQITDVPENTQSLVLIVDDPDAPTGTWVHWTLWNIDPKTREIAGNAVPAGAVQGITSFGKPGYDGPCPPSGSHRYIFKLYALDTKLDLPASTNAKILEGKIQNHIIDQAQMIGLYKRKR